MKRLLVGPVLIIGCSANHSSEQPLTHGLTEAAEHVEELRTLTMDHHATVRSSSDMEVVSAEEHRYQERAGTHWVMMTGEIDEMMLCTDSSGSIPDLTSLSHLRDRCRDDLAAHASAMAEAPDMSAVLAEEDRFHEVMMERLDQTAEMGNRMMREMGSMFRCDVRRDMHGGMMH